MSARGCLDGVSCQCDGLTESLREKRNPIASVVSGILFAIGWWFMIDASVNDHVRDEHQAIGVMSSVGLFMVNSISHEMINGSGLYTGGICGPAGARFWLVIGLMISFGSLIGGTWVMIGYYLQKNMTYAGVCVFLQNLLIFISSLIFKFGRGEDNGYSSW